MKSIGIRVSPTAIRLAVISNETGLIAMLNKSDGVENRLKFPTSCTTESEKLQWWYDELTRILRQNPDIIAIGIKTSEFAGPRRESLSTRFTSHLDAISLLVASQTGVPVYGFVYVQLKVSSRLVRTRAEELVGKLPQYWDDQISDAIVAGESVLRIKS